MTAQVQTPVAPPSVARGPNSLLQRLFQTVLIKRECYINDLWELVGHETISARDDKRTELQRAVDWMLKRLVALDVVAFGEPMGMQIVPETFQTVRMPNCIIGVLTQNPGRPTVLVYGNLDVADAFVENGWSTEPFVLTELGDYLYGRGVAEDKGPLLCWLNAIRAYRDCGLRLPVNLVFLIESMSHSGSLGLETVLQQRISFFREVSCVAIASRRWISNTRPGIIYGSRGLVYYYLEVECANRDLSSCEHGGTLYEALPDLFYLLASLSDCHNNVLIDGAVKPYDVSTSVLRGTDFNYKEFGRNIDARFLPHQKQKMKALDANWALPHITIHGIEGANADREIRFVIPHKVTAKFSIALAPNQAAAEVTLALQHHLGSVWLERGSPNKMVLCEKFAIPSWRGQTDTREYRAAARAVQQTYDMKANFIRDGGAMLAPSLLEEALHKNVVMLPIAEYDNGGGPVNERLSVENYVRGSQLLAAFLWEYGEGVEDPESQAKSETLSNVLNFL